MSIICKPRRFFSKKDVFGQSGFRLGRYRLQMQKFKVFQKSRNYLPENQARKTKDEKK